MSSQISPSHLAASNRFGFILLLLCSLTAAFFSPSILAAGPCKIVVGQTTAFTGPPADNVAEMFIGSSLVFDDANRLGGIRGCQIEVVALDDAFTPAATAANAETLISKHKAIVLFQPRGTPTTEALLPVAARHGVAVLAPSTGAMVFHEPVNPWVFNLRSTYQVEGRKTIEQLISMTRSKIGVIHVNDSFGLDVLAGVMAGFKAAGVEPAFVTDYDRKTNDVTKALAKVAATPTLQALLVIGANNPTRKVMTSVRESGNRELNLVTISTNASQGFVKGLGQHAKGVVLSVVMPKESDQAIGLVRDTSKLLAARGKGERVTPAMLEGAAAARLLVEALKRTADPVTSKRLIATLESGRPFDIGWRNYEVTYTPTDHSGIKWGYSDIAIVGADGRFIR